MSSEPLTDGGQPLFSKSLRTFPWFETAVAGATAFVTEYVVVALLFVVGPASVAVDSLFERLTTYTFVLFGAHQVPVVRSAQQVALPVPARENIVTSQTDPSIPIVVYLAIPVVAVLIAGVVAARNRTDAPGSAVEQSVLVGTGLTIGYVVVGMLFAFVFVDVTYYDPGQITQRVSPLGAFLATVAYPLVLGTVGAFGGLASGVYDA